MTNENLNTEILQQNLDKATIDCWVCINVKRNKTIAMRSGKCAWSEFRFAKSALSHNYGTEKADLLLYLNLVKIIKI